MKKKIIIGVLAFIAVLAAAFAYLNYRNRNLSPPGSTQLTNGDLSISISYSRPSVRGRVVFGTKEQEALQPYGAYWRLGANESTEINFNRDVLFNNNPIKAGTYRVYAFPGSDAFEVGVNTELGKWGYMEPDYSKDILRTKIPVERASAPVEQFTINLLPVEGGINVSFEWADVKVVVPIKNQ